MVAIELSASCLTKRYGATRALDGLELRVDGDWRCVGVLGRNGAGKSTLLKVLVGLLRPSSGSLEVKVDGAGRPHADPRTAAFISEHQLLIAGLTGTQHLEQYEALSRISDVGVDPGLRDQLIRDFELAEHLGKTASSMSKGTRRKLELVAALSARVPLVVADELAEGIDVPSMQLFEQVIARQAALGRRFVISSHNVGFLSEVCDRIVVIDRGKCTGAFGAHADSGELRRRVLEAFGRAGPG